MHLMYADESGDTGPYPGVSPTRYFVPSGIVLREQRWQLYLDSLIAFRRALKQQFGLKMSEEFHAGPLINHPNQLVRIKRNDRLLMIRLFASQLANMPDLNVINVVVDKLGKWGGYDVFAYAWVR